MPSATARRRFLILAGATGAILLVLAGVGIYRLVGRHHSNATLPIAPVPSTISAPYSFPGLRRPRGGLPALPHTADPVGYARAVASALFTWDTTSGLQPQEYENPVIADADPSGYEANGLIADLNGYLPTAQVWQQLRQYDTIQWLTIDKAAIPGSWTGIAESASPQIAHGTVAVTIEGTRHRTGVWQGSPATADHRVSFTVFLACAPAFERCHTLRLSQLDKPLN